VSTSLQTIPEGSPNELGPFGRSFVGEFPSRGTLSLIALGALFSFIIAGGWLSRLLLLIITTYLSIYMSYNFIEPHFNSKVGNIRQKKLDSIASKGHLAMSDIGNMLHGYGKTAAGQVWDLSGEINLGSLFERQPIVDSPNMSEWESESKVRTLMKISILWIAIFFTLYIIAFLVGGLIFLFDIYSIDLFIQFSMIFQFAIMSAILLAVIYLENKFEYLKSLFHFPDISKLKFVGLVAFVMVFDYILVLAYSIFYGSLLPLPEDTFWFVDANSANDPLILFLLFIALSVGAPIVEELIFRGYILDSFRSNFSDKIAIISSGVLFGFMHWDPFFAFFDIYPIGATAIGGFLYAWLRIKTGSLWPSIICHSLWNGTIFLFEFII
jgi:membrane protease YdiL (CAAX protease family)